MNEYLLPLIKKYKQKGLLIDTNIFLLYLVGSIKPSLLSKFSSKNLFLENDIDKLSKFIAYFDVKITTPHILTEVSNLIRRDTDLRETLRVDIEMLSEIFLESRKLIKHTAFNTFGLTDTAIINNPKDSFRVATDDMPLFQYLINSQIDVVSLDQIRAISAD